MEAIDVPNLADYLGGDNYAATRSGGQGLLAFFHHCFHIFFNLLDFFPQIKQSAQSSLGSLGKDNLCILGHAPHPIPQGFLAEWVFELGSVTSVMDTMEQNMKLVLEPGSLLDQPLPF